MHTIGTELQPTWTDLLCDVLHAACLSFAVVWQSSSVLEGSPDAIGCFAGPSTQPWRYLANRQRKPLMMCRQTLSCDYLTDRVADLRRVFVHILGGQSVVLDVQPACTAADLKQSIEGRTGACPAHLHEQHSHVLVSHTHVRLHRARHLARPCLCHGTHIHCFFSLSAMPCTQASLQLPSPSSSVATCWMTSIMAGCGVRDEHKLQLAVRFCGGAGSGPKTRGE